ncbi:MAG: nucleotidyltransferase domain-containing protein [Promethearchaeota archaeon]|nr:MAG: nucleotidyltransferase domain-containing protein [Candidatus Lokiarchaeota archaeon]
MVKLVEDKKLNKKLNISEIKNKCQSIFEKAKLVYLFGSYAKGTNTDLSDLDLAFLFRDTKIDQNSTEIRLDLIHSLKVILNRDVDVIILNKATPLLKFEAINGICLYEKSTRDRILFEFVTINEYLDTKFLRKIQSHYLFERISEYNV